MLIDAYLIRTYIHAYMHHEQRSTTQTLRDTSPDLGHEFNFPGFTEKTGRGRGPSLRSLGVGVDANSQQTGEVDAFDEH